MTNTPNPITTIVRDLEAVQAQVGTIQLALLELIASDQSDDFGESIQDELLKLESVQRIVGETQKGLFMHLRRWNNLVKVQQQSAPNADPKQAAQAPTSATTSPVLPRQWLERCGMRIQRAREESALDSAAERVAQFIGEHYAELYGFYRAIKLRVSKASTWRWYQLHDEPQDAIKLIIKFGNMLHDCGFFSSFHYAKNGQSAQFDPLDDARVTNFFTGGWLEYYTYHLARNIVHNRVGSWSEDQGLMGVVIELPDGTTTELDVLVGLPNDRVLWIECKTGEWGDYIKHFQTINSKYMRLPLSQTALVLATDLTEHGKASTSELAAMSVLHLSQLREWITAAVTQPG